MKNNMILVDLYKKGEGILRKFPAVHSVKEAEDLIKNYIAEHNLTIVARETCFDATWTYLSDGTELDYCLE